VKKLGIVVLMLVLMSGCSGLQVSDANSLALQIAAQRAGFYVGKNNPEIVPHAKLVADGILAQEGNALVKTALNLAITELAKQFPDDPLLEGDLRLIVSALQIDSPEIPIDLAKLHPVIAAFINGMEIGATWKK